MSYGPMEDHRAQAASARSGPVRVFDSPLDTHAVFRALISDEVRTGQMTRSRRRRIVQYASHLGLSAVQVGQMIAECREDSLQSDDPVERQHALKLTEPAPERVSAPVKIALVIAVALIVDVIVVKWWW